METTEDRKELEFPGARTEAPEDEEVGDREVKGGTAPGDSPLTADDLPGAISADVEELNDLVENAPVPAEFPENDAYPTAAQPRRIAEFLIERVHKHLRDARIAYIYRQTLRSSGRPVMGKATKVGRKWRSLSGIDFVLEFNYEEWVHATRRERVRLVDHELMHCGQEEDAEGMPTWTDRNHDVEEFVEIIRRWGPARGQKRFAEAIQQADLFEPTAES